jgi:SAM-dependent methyltransferase
MDLGFHGEVADFYQRYQRGYPAAVIDALAGAFGLTGDDLVVDLGCGTGQLTLPLAGRVRAMAGVDPEPDMLLRARQAAADAGVANVTWMVGADTDLPALGALLGERSVAAVTIGQALHWMNPGQVFRAAAGLARRHRRPVRHRRCQPAAVRRGPGRCGLPGHPGQGQLRRRADPGPGHRQRLLRAAGQPAAAAGPAAAGHHADPPGPGRARPVHRARRGVPGARHGQRSSRRLIRRPDSTRPAAPMTARYAADHSRCGPTSPSVRPRSSATPWYSGDHSTITPTALG